MTPSPLQLADDAEAPGRNQRAISKRRSRAKILLSARRLFAEKGYANATVREIAEGAGLSTGAVFISFADKPDLLIAVLDADREALTKVMREGAVGDSVEERLLAMFTAGYRRALPDLPLLQHAIGLSWCPVLGERVRGCLERWPSTGLVADVLQAAVERGELAPGFDVPLVSQMLWDCFLNNLRHAAFEGSGLDHLVARLRNQMRILLTPPRQPSLPNAACRPKAATR